MGILAKTKQTCYFYNIKPSRSKGQNFLISKEIYSKIKKEGELNRFDQVLEIGPGLGFMTEELIPEVDKVVAVELDDKLSRLLQSKFKNFKADKVKILNRDILKTKLPSNFSDRKYKIIANLPYNITSNFLKNFLSGRNKPELMVLLVQKEVAERITAHPPNMSLLALSVQYYAEPFFVKKVKAGNFWPQPRVDSAIIKLKIKNNFDLPFSFQEEKKFFRLIRVGFSAKRKMLKNNLAKELGQNVQEVEKKLKELNFNPGIRAQELSLKDWSQILFYFKNDL